MTTSFDTKCSTYKNSSGRDKKITGVSICDNLMDTSNTGWWQSQLNCMHTYYKYRCQCSVKSAGFVGRMRYKDNYVKRRRKTFISNTSKLEMGHRLFHWTRYWLMHALTRRDCNLSWSIFTELVLNPWPCYDGNLI